MLCLKNRGMLEYKSLTGMFLWVTPGSYYIIHPLVMFLVLLWKRKKESTEIFRVTVIDLS